MKRTVFLLVISLIIILSACQSDKEKADNLRLENKFEEAAELYQQLADEGDAYAKWRLFKAYYLGEGVDFDESKALKWLKQAAEEGCEEAKFDLAFAYMFDYFDIGKDTLKGKEMLDALIKNSSNAYVMSRYAILLFYGISPYEENKEKAMNILNKVSDKNDPFYNWAMGLVYLDGTDEIDIDVEKSIEFFTKSFYNGRHDSADLIQDIYANGYGDLKKDVTKQIEWIKRGIESNSTDCMVDMAKICISEDSIYKDYHNPQRAVELLKRAALHGSGEAYGILGDFYYSGDHLPKDDTKAFKNWEKAAHLKYLGGISSLAYAYLEGIGCGKDEQKGVELHKKAADEGSGFSANNLFSFYYFGKYGLKLDMEQAKRYLLKSAELNDDDGCFNLGIAYYYGDMVNKNVDQAFVYLKKAADMGHIDACERIAEFYEKGIGCNKDPNKAKEYRDKTIASGTKKEESINQ